MSRNTQEFRFKKSQIVDGKLKKQKKIKKQVLFFEKVKSQIRAALSHSSSERRRLYIKTMRTKMNIKVWLDHISAAVV